MQCDWHDSRLSTPQLKNEPSDETPVNYPTLLTHRLHGSFVEGGASCFQDALSIHDVGSTR